MIEIKNVVFTKVQMDFLNSFFCFLNYLLPLRLKFKNESFVILEDNIKNALITLDKDSKSNTRFKITKLVLEENSFSNVVELVKYVTTRYRAMGANSFYIVIDEKNPDLLNLFKNELNFRHCAMEYLFKVENLNKNFAINLKHPKKESIKNITDFYNENINSFNRFLFSREKYQFKNNFLKYVFLGENEEILGYFEVATNDNVDFYLNFTLDCTYNIYLMDAIKAIYSKLSRKYKNFNLYIKVKDYFLNSKELLAILKENDIKFISKSLILAKDYYKPVKANDILKNAKIIFNDPTTA